MNRFSLNRLKSFKNQLNKSFFTLNMDHKAGQEF